MASVSEESLNYACILLSTYYFIVFKLFVGVSDSGGR